MSSRTTLPTRNFPRILGKLLLEIAIIITGVLIALFVDRLNQDYQDQVLIEKTMASFSKEFGKNSQEIRKSQSNIKAYIDSLYFYRRIDTLGPNQILTRNGGIINIPDLTGTTWKILERSNVLENTDFELIYLLTTIELTQTRLTALEERIADSIFNGPRLNVADYKGAKTTLLILLTNYRDQTEELLKLYGQFAKKAKEQHYRLPAAIPDTLVPAGNP